MSRTRFEVSTFGFNPLSQGIATDPYGGAYQVGIRIPSNPTTDFRNRYQFTLAMAEFDANTKVHLVGARQLVVIGQMVTTGEQPNQCSYPLYREVESPYWTFVDGNIYWAIRRQPLIYDNNANAFNKEGQSFRHSQTPALLFENPPDTGYSPPFGAQPQGNSLVPDLAGFHDLRFPWRNADSWQALDIEIEGPCRIIFYASVQQTNPESRCKYTIPTANVLGLDSLTKEDAFIATNGPAPLSNYQFIAGSLIFETENFYGDPRVIVEPVPRAEGSRCPIQNQEGDFVR